MLFSSPKQHSCGSRQSALAHVHSFVEYCQLRVLAERGEAFVVSQPPRLLDHLHHRVQTVSMQLRQTVLVSPEQYGYVLEFVRIQQELFALVQHAVELETIVDCQQFLHIVC